MNRERQLGALQILLEDMRAVIEGLIPGEQETIGPVELPPLDFIETASHLIVKIDLPGVDPDALQIHIIRDHLIIRAMKQEPPVSGKVNYLCMERSFGPLLRIVALGKPVNPERITATYNHGGLAVKMEKIHERRGRPITVAVTTTGRDNRAEKTNE